MLVKGRHLWLYVFLFLLKGVKSVEDANGLKGLEFLEYSSNDNLRGHANHILTMYMYKEDVQFEGKKADDGNVPQAEETPDSTPMVRYVVFIISRH